MPDLFLKGNKISFIQDMLFFAKWLNYENILAIAELLNICKYVQEDVEYIYGCWKSNET